MDAFFYQHFGLSPEAVNYFILPLLIFIARVGDVSISTIRIIFVMGSDRLVAPILGFFEALIWLLAIGQIISNIDNVGSYIAYASGFAMGTFVGITIENKLALGKVVLRLITHKPIQELIDYFHDEDVRYSLLDAQGRTGKVNILFLVVKRDKLQALLQGIDRHHPNAFYTIEGVKQVRGDLDLSTKNAGRRSRVLQSKRK